MINRNDPTIGSTCKLDAGGGQGSDVDGCYETNFGLLDKRALDVDTFKTSSL